jgi:virulence-associated protein VagC
MTYRGTVRSGVVVLPTDVSLPEGAEVVVVVSEGDQATEKIPGIWAKLEALGRWAETLPTDLPPDLAKNHDHYLHGRHQAGAPTIPTLLTGPGKVP